MVHLLEQFFYILNREKRKAMISHHSWCQFFDKPALFSRFLFLCVSLCGLCKHVTDNIPMPAAARYCARGQPSPPQPTTNTEVLDKLNCPKDNRKKRS